MKGNKFEQEPIAHESYTGDESVEIPENLLKQFKAESEEFKNLHEDEERWDILNDRHNQRMQGNTEEDLFYQLFFWRLTEGDPGVNAKIRDIEEKLSSCWCGSGKKLINCHGK